jgi:protein-S-isoprenylcysteine O-methyltransferase Ste14
MNNKTLRSLLAPLVGAVVGAAVVLVAIQFVPSSALAGGPLAVLERFGLTPWVLVADGLWGAFGVYWEIAARCRDTRAVAAESGWSRGAHVALTSLAQLLLLLPIPGLRAGVLPQSTALAVAGLIVEVAFLALAVWARRVLGRNWSGIIATNTDHQLVRSGPYARLRHPIYTAILGMYLGLALVSGEVHGLIGLAVGVAAYWRKIGLEERHLDELFGAAYEEYRKKTWALIPGVL